MRNGRFVVIDSVILFLFFLCHGVNGAKWKIISFGDKDAINYNRIASAFAPSVLYTFGGEFEGQYSGEFKSFDPLKRKWSTILTSGVVPSHRAGATLTKIATALYLIGGHNEHGTLASIHQYDLITNKWQHVLLPEGITFTSRSGHAACTDGKNRIFVFGGYNDEGLFLNDLYEIAIISQSDSETGLTNPIATVKLLNTVSDNRTVNPSPREHCTMNIVEDKLYVYGGYSYGGSVRDLMWVFDISTSKWTMVDVQLLPPPSEGMASLTMGRSIYYFGGCDFSFVANRCYGDLWKYDTVSSKLTIIPTGPDPRPAGRAFSAMGFLNGGIILHGGSKLDKNIFGDTHQLVELLPCKDPQYSCLGRGECHQSWCLCNKGFEGHDCSIELVPPTVVKTNAKVDTDM